jgi:septal ring factor EnvC (AmiA/AmiB activator)
VALQQHAAQLTEKYDHLSAAYQQLKAEHAQQRAEHAQQRAEDAQRFAQQKGEHDQLREFVMNMASQSGDTCAPPRFWSYNNQPPPHPPPAPPLC